MALAPRENFELFDETSLMFQDSDLELSRLCRISPSSGRGHLLGVLPALPASPWLALHPWGRL